MGYIVCKPRYISSRYPPSPPTLPVLPSPHVHTHLLLGLLPRLVGAELGLQVDHRRAGRLQPLALGLFYGVC